MERLVWREVMPAPRMRMCFCFCFWFWEDISGWYKGGNWDE